ncbi:hypothetical protein WKV44_10450 [Spirochaetia bacterium 38H-sp]|uniref:Uncharacterized protein n=1 Tax=Rarispira pelagica TaxID=3141764 RepID=A0ABU9UG42_9SPIR
MLYVAFSDREKERRLTVMRYDGTGWEEVGEPGFSHGEVDDISLAVEEGIPYVAFGDGAHGRRITVMRYNGERWETIGQPGFSGNYRGNAFAISDIRLVVENGIPYVAYPEENQLKDGDPPIKKPVVMRYNGEEWERLGRESDFTNEIFWLDLAVEDGISYIIYDDPHDPTVMRYNGKEWEPVGEPHFASSAIFYPNIVIYKGTPYAAFKLLHGLRGVDVFLYKYDGIKWDIVPRQPLLLNIPHRGDADYVSLAIDDGVPYIACVAAYGKIKVVKYD